jgi:hypothetical protein
MKKITLLFIFCLTMATWTYGQCFDPVYQYPPTTVAITSNPGLQTIAADNWPQNEFSVLSGLVIGESYTVSATPDVTDPDYTPGAMTYITVTSDGTTVINSGFDSVSFVATTTGITIYWTLDAACNDGPNLNTLTQIECTTCSCTATAAPAPINPTPANNSTTVQIIPDGADLVITPFAWEEAVPGNEADSYSLSLGATSAGNDIGTIAVATNGNGIIYTWAENTQYWWFVTGTNCQGTTQSAVWTFTTSACTETAAPGCTNLVSPTANQMDVATVEAGNMTREVNLSWDPIAGASAYRITFDGAELGNTSETDIDIFGLEYNTSYTWSIAPVNCFGASTGCETRTFTTEEDPDLSVAQFDQQSLSVYPNPVKNQLTIKTELSIESVKIFNILGKQVKSISGDSILNNRVDMSALVDGVYFLNISAEGKQQTIKVIKQ